MGINLFTLTLRYGKARLIVAMLLMLSAGMASAQHLVSGVVKEAGTETPLIGVNIYEKTNPENGTASDAEGRFSLTLASPDALIVASYVGYDEVVVSVEGKTEVNISMVTGLALNEVVVTALGIEREKKALGYAVQEISGEDLTIVRSSNLVNNLAGQLAGVQVTGVNNGVASSSRIVIRGENSLNINNNSPLFVVDGVPVNNSIYGVGGGSTNQADMPTDYGNGASEINPEDIASISVLRGAAASALYGSRAANGVVVITTKSGKARKGLGVQFTSSTMFSNPLVLPDIQTEYGGGWGLEYYSDYGTNFGPSLKQNLAVVQDGSPGFAEGKEEDFLYRYKLEDFFQTGVNTNNQVSISGGSDKGAIRFSYANSYNTGIVPNTNLKRDNFNLNTSYNLNKKWLVNVSASYIKSGSDNLPVAGYGGQGLMYTLLWNYLNVDLKWLEDYWYEEDRVQRGIFSWADNPFLIINEHINAFDKDRLFGNISTTYQISPSLSLMLRAGTDYSNELRTSRRPMGSVYHPNGMYREQGISFRENNMDFLLSHDQRLGHISTRISVGGNRFTQSLSESFLEGQSLAIPGIYTLGNINVTPALSRYAGTKAVNSLYAFANIGFKDYFYLDVTARNDWSSTLPSNENAYFYPSFSLSFIPSEVFNMGQSVDYLKARFNVARVGKDTDPFQLQKTYAFGALPNSVTNPLQLPNALLRPEQTDSWEIGLEANLFKRRVFAELTYYNTTSTNQIISFAVSGASGYESVFANAGKIKNSGIEAILGLTPVRTKNLEWTIATNFTANDSEVLELFGGLESYIIAQGPDGVTVEARPGGRMGDIYGNTYVRSPDGQIVYNSNGLPLLGPRENVGNYNPDWMMGLSSSLSFKGLRLYGLLDIRKGGIIYSYTHAIGHESGILASSLPGREEGIVGEGVVQNPDGSYVPNTTVVDAETWYYGGVYPRENAEANSFDASYIKLRELSLSYTLPNKWLGKNAAGALTVALVGNNLALWTDVPNIDPEAQALNGGTLIPGMEVTQLPSTRSYGFKINLDF